MKASKNMTIVILATCIITATIFIFFFMNKSRQPVSHNVQSDKPVPQNMEALIETVKRNSISFKINEEKPVIAAGQSKFGGMPDVPKDFKWPKTKSGLSLSFLAQVNCSEISSLDMDGLLPATGIFYFFCELSDMDWEGSGNDSSVRILYYNPDSPNTLSPRSFPDNLARENRMPGYALEFEAIPSFPFWDDLETIYKGQKQMKLFYSDKYEDLLEKMESRKHNGRLLGYADVLQNGMLEGKPDPGNAILLFQLNSFDAPDGSSLMFGDCGNIYFYIQRDDLSRLDFSRIRFEAQCY